MLLAAGEHDAGLVREDGAHDRHPEAGALRDEFLERNRPQVAGRGLLVDVEASFGDQGRALSTRRGQTPPGFTDVGQGPGAVAAFRDRAVEQPFRGRGAHQGVHRHPARRDAEDRHPLRIAAEGRGVSLHPLESGHHVEHAVVRLGFAGGLGLRGQGRMGEEAEHAQPVLDADHDDAPAREAGAAAGSGSFAEAAVAAGEAAAVNPDHDRQRFVAGAIGWGPHVQVQAVLALRELGAPLRADGAVVGGYEWLGPRVGGLGRTPAQLTLRWRGEGDAQEGRDVVGVLGSEALNRAVVGVDQEGVGRLGGAAEKGEEEEGEGESGGGWDLHGGES